MLVSTVLSLDNISKSFGARKILADVSWSMADDGRVGLVGLNGAGKIHPAQDYRRGHRGRFWPTLVAAAREGVVPASGVAGNGWALGAQRDALRADAAAGAGSATPGTREDSFASRRIGSRARLGDGRVWRCAQRVGASRFLYRREPRRSRFCSGWVLSKAICIAMSRNSPAVSGCGSRWPSCSSISPNS